MLIETSPSKNKRVFLSETLLSENKFALVIEISISKLSIGNFITIACNLHQLTLPEMCPNKEIFLVHTFTSLNWIQIVNLGFPYNQGKIRTTKNFALGHFSGGVIG